ncbi:MAG: hypothetical protein RR273_06530 [Oscillospiraceae bacterium]
MVFMVEWSKPSPTVGVPHRTKAFAAVSTLKARCSTLVATV